TFLREAQAVVNGPNPGYLAAAEHVQSAIETLRKIPGKQESVKELHRLLLDYQEKSLSQMGRIEVPFEVSEFQEKTRESVKGKTIQQALFALAFIGRSPQIHVLRKQVVESAKKFPFHGLISVTTVNEEGKTVGRRPAMLSSTLDEAEQA